MRHPTEVPAPSRVRARARARAQPYLSAPPVAGIPYPLVALGLAALGQVLASIDMSALVIAMPTLADEFDVGANTILWAPLTFTLVTTASGLGMGRLGDLYGRKRMYVIGLTLFGCSAVVSALAGSAAELVFGRVVQGFGAAMVVGNSVAIVAAFFPAERRGLAIGVMSATTGAGMAAGPIFGGLMIQELDWRAIFWTRIPLGLLLAGLVWRLLVDIPPERRPRGIDLAGSLLLFALLFTLVLALNRGEAWGWFSVSVLTLFGVSLATLPLFLRHQRRAPSPVLALDLFRNAGFSAGTAAILLQFIGFAAVVFLLPFMLIDARGFSTLEAGGISAALPLSLLVLSPVSGLLSDRVSPRLVMGAGLVIMAGGMFFLSTMTATTPVAGIVVRLIVVGAGTALFQSPNIAMIMAAAPADRLGTASGAAVTFRQIGQSFGIALAGALFTARAIDFAGERSAAGLDDSAVRPEAFASGFELAMLVGASIVLSGVVVAWLAGRPRPRPRAALPVPDRSGD